MTKETVKYIIKRLSYFSRMLEEGKTEEDYRIGKRKEHLVINGEVLEIIKIIDEIIESEETLWLRQMIREMRSGRKDISIQYDSPVERTKYYMTKERFISKVYECCIFKGYVSYEDILKSKIG